MDVLVIEDEQKVADYIKLGLEEQSYKVNIAYDGLAGAKLAMNNKYDIIIIDVLLPIISGYDLCKMFRDQKILTPILLLTALSSIEDKIQGFDRGADDYLVKPFDFRELVARMKSLLKRKEDLIPKVNILTTADLEMNIDQMSVRRAGKKIELTTKEFALLEYFMRNSGKAISRTDIASKVWDISFDTGTNVIDVYVNFLRKKIDKDFTPKLIHTIKGTGYIFKVEEA